MVCKSRLFGLIKNHLPRAPFVSEFFEEAERTSVASLNSMPLFYFLVLSVKFQEKPDSSTKGSVCSSCQ